MTRVLAVAFVAGCATARAPDVRRVGGEEYSGVISRFMDALVSGKQPVIYGDGEQSRDFTYISNVVEANFRAVESSAAVGKVINVANGESVTLNQLLDTMKSIVGKGDVAPRYEPPRRGDVRHSLADLTRARELLGYEPKVSLEDGLRRTFDWWKTNH